MTMRAPETELLARITAGLTHEMRNVLAIVGETSGLIEDLLAMRKPRKDLHERLSRAVGGIQRQVGRGTDLSDGLNRLAHTLDGPETPLPPDDFAELVVLLLRRTARSGEVGLTFRESPAASWPGPIPSRFLLAACACLERVVLAAPPGSGLTVHAEDRSNGAALRILPDAPDPSTPPTAGAAAPPPGWDGIFAEIRGAVEALPAEEGPGLRVSVAGGDG